MWRGETDWMQTSLNITLYLKNKALSRYKLYSIQSVKCKDETQNKQMISEMYSQALELPYLHSKDLVAVNASSCC